VLPQYALLTLSLIIQVSMVVAIRHLKTGTMGCREKTTACSVGQ
jgi:hypothetical protein